ncbi:conserved hypothetical protein [Ricinus communis]|uniref:Uncharacterized protein n=1 Tax=Ricinus communis TaxID=3988 RepID=B9S9S7_RICCO|nr:conserved hypothetical protein [Ricinus communis]
MSALLSSSLTPPLYLSQKPLFISLKNPSLLSFRKPQPRKAQFVSAKSNGGDSADPVCLIYGSSSCLLGQVPRLPIVAEAADRQVVGTLNIYCQMVIVATDKSYEAIELLVNDNACQAF